MAKTTDPATWGTLAAAVRRVQLATPADAINGIGFVFSAGDPFTGIDLDGCRNPGTGELTAEAATIITALGSYTEASPSGTGVHIIVQASIPAGRKRSNIEMYSHSRFFCFTGERVGLVKEVVNCQNEVNALYNQVFGAAAALTPATPQSLEISDPLLAAVRHIPDNDLLKVIERNEELYRKLIAGDLTVLQKDQSASAADYALCCVLARYTRCDAPRIDCLFRKTPLWRQKWDKRHGAETYGAMTVARAIAEVVRSKAQLYDPTVANSGGPRRLSDGSNTDLFIELTENTFAWVPEWATWLRWQGVYWQRGADEDVFNAVRLVSDHLWDEYRANKEFKELAVWAKQSDNFSRQRNIEQWARYRLHVKAHELDTHPYLLPCKNGVVDLRTGSLRAGERSDLMTRGVEWAYVPDAECPVFSQFVEEIMMGDEEMIDYLWRVLGYCLTGETGARSFFILHGVGRNGKSTWARALQTMLGMRAEGYAQTARFETFLQGQRNASSADPDIAGLAGARVAIASEVNPGSKYRLDGARIKQFTGEDWVKARFLYAPEFQFLPVCKIFLVVNHIPHIDESARALYDRLHYIEFKYRIPDEKVDAMLQWKILGEMEGILARAVQAAGQYYEQLTIAPPASVLQARDRIASEMDPWQGLWELCHFAPGHAVTHNDLYAAYLRMCGAEHIKTPRSTRALSKALAQRGCEQFRQGASSAVAWRGIGLRAPQVDADAPAWVREPGEDADVV